MNPLCYVFTAFIVLNVLQSGFTRWCLMEGVLLRVGIGTEEY